MGAFVRLRSQSQEVSINPQRSPGRGRSTSFDGACPAARCRRGQLLVLCNLRMRPLIGDDIARR
jgi:hypothetical protein